MTVVLSVFLVTLVSLCCAFVLWYFDRRRDRFLISNGKRNLEMVQSIETIQTNKKCSSIEPTAKIEEKTKLRVTLTAILKFPLSVWLLCFILATFYAGTSPVTGFGQLFFVTKFDQAVSQASTTNALFYFVGIPGSTICGLLVDYFGRNLLFILISALLAIFGHILLAFTFLTPSIAVIILGCASSLFNASLWSSVAFAIPESSVATAYGFMQSTQSLGLSVAFILAGVILDDYGYLVLEIFMITVISLTLAAAILLYFIDFSRNGYLIMNAATRKAKLNEHKHSE